MLLLLWSCNSTSFSTKSKISRRMKKNFREEYKSNKLKTTLEKNPRGTQPILQSSPIRPYTKNQTWRIISHLIDQLGVTSIAASSAAVPERECQETKHCLLMELMFTQFVCKYFLKNAEFLATHFHPHHSKFGIEVYLNEPITCGVILRRPC